MPKGKNFVVKKVFIIMLLEAIAVETISVYDVAVQSQSSMVININ